MARAGNFLKDMVSDELAGIFGGPVVGNVGGVLTALGNIAKSMVTRDGALFKESVLDLFASGLMLRSGSRNGWRHRAQGGTKTADPSTPNHRAGRNHDKNAEGAGFFKSSTHFQYGRDAFSGPGQFMGPWGQAYRIYATVGLGTAGAALWAVGR